MIVSIIVPVYNVEHYIERCLDSIANQTYKNIECILVDDCGSDDSMVKCAGFIANYNGSIQFSIIKHSQNRGLSAARNTGTDACSGDYIYYLDSDDYLLPNCIELLVEKIYQYPEVELVQGTTYACPYKRHYSMKDLRDIDFVNEKYCLRRRYFNTTKIFPVNAWNKLLKRSFLLEYNLHFKEGLIHEDAHWMYFVALHLKSFAVVHHNTYVHVATENSIMSTSTMERTAENFGNILSDVLDNLMEPYSSNALLFYLSIFVAFYGNTKNNQYPQLYTRFLEQLNCRRMYILATLLRIQSFLLPYLHGKITRTAIRAMIKVHLLIMQYSGYHTSI